MVVITRVLVEPESFSTRIKISGLAKFLKLEQLLCTILLIV